MVCQYSASGIVKERAPLSELIFVFLAGCVESIKQGFAGHAELVK